MFSAMARNFNRKGVNLTESFSRVYSRKEWGPEGGGSGGGSTMKNTHSIRSFLMNYIANNRIYNLLDAPCGAMEWLPSVLVRVEGKVANFTYTGMDIVPSLIEHNIRRFSTNHTNWAFICGDIASTPITKAYDLVMSRDVFFHLTFDKIMCALNNFSNSGSKLLLTTNNPGAPNYNESTSWKVRLNEGGFRDVDLCAPPLSLPQPLLTIDEKESSRIMAIWSLPIPKLFTHDVDGTPLRCDSMLS
jgi:hypothetical protein